MTNRGDGFFADFDGMDRNSWSVNDAAEYARELQQWLSSELAVLDPIWGEGDKFADDMDQSLGVLRTSIDEYLGFLVIAAQDTSAILSGSKEQFGRAEENNINAVPDMDTPGGPGGRR
ncbi:hypothetical protein [Nocardiopsis alborubida]|uniref:WXG100 family type VII secretion target n=1 Tax=Nocardiopsis alborubida TaxID=146802 RepID=A0A7X6RSH4_9ACTN|nr:hypothetical protein [Nocardiopsis alborubida]NKZ00960.1 hypothetical protein [Nocardiopsis alborubida]